MSIQHHPRSDILLAYAAGSLEEAASVLVASHLTLCPACRAMVGRMEAVGGAMLDRLPGAGFEDARLARIMSKLDAPVTQDNQPADTIPNEAFSSLPRPLQHYVTGRPWKRLGGVEYITLTTTGRGVGRLLRVPPGGRIPYHGHTGAEHVLVLAGGFHDGTGDYVRGDVSCADTSLAHAPVAENTEPCVCMTVNEGMVLFTRLLAPLARLFPRASEGH
jgi:putative transcriptional regulator